MLRATVKSLLARKLRLVLTALAIVLGVGFTAGTFVLTDTISHTFDTIFVSEQIAIIKTPVRAPVANAFAERWIGTLRRECLDRILILGKVISDASSTGTSSGTATTS